MLQKKVYLSALIFLLNSSAFAQENILLNEEFNDNSRNWTNFRNEKASAHIEDGKYYINEFRETGSWHFYTYQFLNPESDYTIEARLTQSSGVDNNGYGLVFASRDYENYNTFVVSSNGYYKIYGYKDDKYSEICGWTTSDLVKGMGKENILAIKKMGKLYRFFINGKEVFYSSKITHFGSQIGFALNKKMSVEIDNIIIKHPPVKINEIPNAIQGYKKENLGTNINSEYEDLSPQISPDGKTLYFDRKKHPGNTGGKNDHDDIWYSELQKDGTWGPAVNIGKPLNNTSNNWVISVAPDGNSMMVAHTYNEDGTYKSSGVSITYRTEDGWSIPKELKIKNYYNNNKYVSYFLSADRKFLILSVERDDTYGEKDLYVCFANEDGNWSAPKNLGPVVNTFEEDMTPFLAADNVTLYYSTEGKPGYGNADIFLTRRLDDTWENWSEPQNLGPEINSPKWDAYYSVPASGEYAYLVSSDNSIGNGDIFKIKLPESAKPQPVVLVFGKVLNSKTNEPIGTDIHYHDLSTNTEVGIASSNPKNGDYKIVLPSGRNYDFLASKDGYYSISENLQIKTVDKYTEIERNLYLAPLEAGTVIRLNNLFFDTNKSDLKQESIGELDRLVKLLLDNPTMTIEIGGHTDNVGADDYNMKLSDSRVKSVINYLTSKNVEAVRLQGKGYGETKPIVPNTTDEGKAKNRRVEFTIIKI